jgi:prepilin-type N-terminal cleavage/methylation domain-containing protein
MMLMSQRLKKNRFSSPKGLTLIELLIALVLAAIIGGALYQGVINQSRSFIQQDQLAEAQQNSRIAMDNILRELRMAGYGMSYAVEGSENTVNDRGLVLGSVKLINGTTVVTNNNSSNYTDGIVIRKGDQVPWTILQYKIKHHGDWAKVTFDEKIIVRWGDPDYVLLMTFDKKEYRTGRVMEKGLDDEFAKRKAIWIEDYPGSFASTKGTDPKTDYGGGICTKLKEIAFYIDIVTSSGIEIPVLMKAVNASPSQVVARYVEDLQIAYQAYDAATNTWTWYRGGAGTTQSDPPADNHKLTNIRNMRVSVIGRARVANPKNIYSQPAVEDGTSHPTSGADGYARRVLTSQIKLRNYGID